MYMGIHQSIHQSTNQAIAPLGLEIHQRMQHITFARKCNRHQKCQNHNIHIGRENIGAVCNVPVALTTSCEASG